MKLATCTRDGKQFLAAVITEIDCVVDLKTFAKKHYGSLDYNHIYEDMLTFLRGGDLAFDNASELLSHTLGSDSHCIFRVEEVLFEAPILFPGKLFCLAGNYQEHIEECNGKMDVQDTETPRVFMKPPINTVIGNGEAIQIPQVGQAIDWEGELAVVIGKHAKSVKAENALSHVAGYTIMNDVSERKLKIKERSSSRPKDEWFDWLNGKWFDTFAPMGPWIVSGDEIFDPHNLEICTFVNGELKQQNSTSQMLMKIPDIIEYISAFVTLQPGDVISTGTIAGVGAPNEEYLQDGDVVTISISGIGELSNTVVKDNPKPAAESTSEEEVASASEDEEDAPTPLYSSVGGLTAVDLEKSFGEDIVVEGNIEEESEDNQV